jgi:hypothetical protein
MTQENKRIIRTLNQWEEKFRKDNPKITRAINETIEELNADDYEAMILLWTNTAFNHQEETIAAEEKAAADRAALLTKLGISEDEAKLLLS